MLLYRKAFWQTVVRIILYNLPSGINPALILKKMLNYKITYASIMSQVFLH